MRRRRWRGRWRWWLGRRRWWRREVWRRVRPRCVLEVVVTIGRAELVFPRAYSFSTLRATWPQLFLEVCIELIGRICDERPIVAAVGGNVRGGDGGQWDHDPARSRDPGDRRAPWALADPAGPPGEPDVCRCEVDAIGDEVGGVVIKYGRAQREKYGKGGGEHLGWAREVDVIVGRVGHVTKPPLTTGSAQIQHADLRIPRDQLGCPRGGIPERAKDVGSARVCSRPLARVCRLASWLRAGGRRCGRRRW